MHVPVPRRLVLVAAGVLLAVALGLLGWGLLRSVAFLGVGPDEQFAQWAATPLLGAGAAAGLSAAVSGGLMTRRNGRSPGAGRLLSAVGLATLAAVLIAVGLLTHHHRLHPTRAELRAAAALALPAATTHDVTTRGGVPFGSDAHAAPAGYGPPVVVRTWGPARCPDLDASLRTWADQGSIRRPAGKLAPGVSCLRFATHDGYSVRASVIDGHVVLVIAPPRVEL